MTASTEPILLNVLRDRQSVVLTLDSGEVLEVALDALPTDLPDAGQRLPRTLLEQLRSGAERKAIARRLFSLLDRRLYPAAALMDKLRAEGHADARIAEVLAEFAAKGLHSDRRFAEAYCRDTLLRKPVGKRYLLAKLRERGISSAEAEAAIAETLTPDREQQAAMQAARQRWSHMREGGRRAEAKVMRFLLGRGFTPALARRAAREALPPIADDSEPT